MRTLEEFMGMVSKTDDATSCWLWQGGKEGSVNWCGNVVPVRRLAWQLQKGKLDGPCRITTTCKDKLCVRPDHLIKKDVEKSGPRVQKEKVAKEPKLKRLPKVPTVVIDNPKLTALLRELVGEADRVEKKCDRALILCYQAYMLIDQILIKLSESKDRVDSIAKDAITLYKSEDLRAMAEEGKIIMEGSKE